MRFWKLSWRGVFLNSLNCPFSAALILIGPHLGASLYILSGVSGVSASRAEQGPSSSSVHGDGAVRPAAGAEERATAGLQHQVDVIQM